MPTAIGSSGGSAKTMSSFCQDVPTLCCRRLSPVSRAPTLALTGILALTASVARLAAALSLTFVLAFASMFAFFRIIRQGLEGDARFRRRACSIGAHGEGSSQKASNGRSGNYCFGLCNHVVLFLFVVSVYFSLSRNVSRGTHRG